MKNITRFETGPVNLTGQPPLHPPLGSLPQLRIRVREDALGYIVMLELPGVRHDDIDIVIADNEVSITTSAAVISRPTQYNSSQRDGGPGHEPFSDATELIDLGGQLPHAGYPEGILAVTLPKSLYRAVKSITRS